MGWLISSIIGTVIVFGLLATFLPKPKWVRFLSLLCLLIMLPGMIVGVPTGHTGILTRFGEVLDGTLEAGMHIIKPWESIVNMDNRVQKYRGTCSAFSKDLQQVDIICSVNYSIDKATAMNLYRDVGVNYCDTVMVPRLAEIIKTNFGIYDAESLISNRMELSDTITVALRTEMEKYGINIHTVNIEDLDFTDAFTDAVEAKQVAEQERLRNETVQRQLTYEAEQEAQRRTIQAQADMEVANKQADAARYAKEQEALGNQAIAESLTDGLIKYMYAENWNGVLPQVQMNGADGVYPVIDLQ